MKVRLSNEIDLNTDTQRSLFLVKAFILQLHFLKAFILNANLKDCSTDDARHR